MIVVKGFRKVRRQGRDSERKDAGSFKIKQVE